MRAAQARGSGPAQLGIPFSSGDVPVLLRPVEESGRLAPLVAQIERIHGVASVSVRTLHGADVLLEVHLSRPVPLAAELRAALGQGMSTCSVVDDRIEVQLSGLVGRGSPLTASRTGWRTGQRRAAAKIPSVSAVEPAPDGGRLFPSLAHREAAATMIGALGSMADVSILMYDADLRFRAAAGAPHERFGYVAETVIGRPVAEVVPPTAWPPLAPGFEAALAGRTTTIEFSSQDGSSTYEATYSPVSDDSRVVGGIVVSRDITARRRTESLLTELTETFELTFDRSPIAQALMSPTGGWLRTNDAFCALLGRDEATLIASSHAALTHPDDRELEARRLREMLAGYRDGYDLHKRYLHPDGHEIPTHLWVALVRAEDGAPRGLIAQAVDITELTPLPTQA